MVGQISLCVEMLEQIRADGGNVKKYVELAKNKRERLPFDGLWASRLQEL